MVIYHQQVNSLCLKEKSQNVRFLSCYLLLSLMTVVSYSLNEEVGVLLRCSSLNTVAKVHNMSSWSSLFKNLMRSLFDSLLTSK
mmetsp:Transcript_33690/g.49333  ORF Transcript_33690/g.49333 Transcript_33690/m.49333 type:complete len:84 (-) Transcript_33690:1180-1431(-)